MSHPAPRRADGERRAGVFHVAVTAAPDFFTRRDTCRAEHLARLRALHQDGRYLAGGPSLDGRSADLFFRLPDADEVRRTVEEDPYWRAGLWTRCHPRRFASFLASSEPAPVVTDGSRRTVVVEATARDPARALSALRGMQETGRLALGGIFEDRSAVALTAAGAEPAEVMAWFHPQGAWVPESLRARVLLRVF